MAERKTGAGMHLSGVLERTPPRPASRLEPEEVDSPGPIPGAEPPDNDPPMAGRGRGGPRAESPRRARAAVDKAARKIKGRTIYIPDDLFERILVQAHRRDKTISEYVVMLLERQVPDHRTVRADPAEGEG